MKKFLRGAAIALGLVAMTSQVAVASDMLAMHNAARSSAGLSTLKVDSTLSAGALAYSQQMATSRKLAHSSPGERPGSYVQVIENVGKVRADTGQSGMFQMFMDSPSHRPAILHPDATHIGIGIVTDEKGVIWATVWFGISSKPEPKPEPTPKPEPKPEPAPEPKPEPKTNPTPDPTPDPEPTVENAPVEVQPAKAEIAPRWWELYPQVLAFRLGTTEVRA